MTLHTSCVYVWHPVNMSFVCTVCLWAISNVLYVHVCLSLPAHVPLNVWHCIRPTVTLCIWEPLILLGQRARSAVCGNKPAFQRMFVHMACMCIPTPQRGGWGQRGWEWWVMPEVVFYQPLRWVVGSLMAFSVGWLTDLLALSGSFFHIWWWRVGDGDCKVVKGGAAALCLHAGSGGQSTRVPWSKHRSLKDSKRAGESLLHGRQLDGSGQIHGERVW